MCNSWVNLEDFRRNVGANSVNVFSRTFPHFSQPMLTPRVIAMPVHCGVSALRGGANSCEE